MKGGSVPLDWKAGVHTQELAPGFFILNYGIPLEHESPKRGYYPLAYYDGNSGAGLEEEADGDLWIMTVL
ncbi:MAG: hypothetical protein LBC60_08960 [Spirochaetaceae bacterium]|nr:hypothetical protein [Spirochaetaceae bacterium]